MLIQLVAISFLAVPLGMGQTAAREVNPHLVKGLRDQPVAGVTLGAFCAPDEFLGRVADRIVRMDYQRRFRSVHAQAATAPAAASTAEPSPGAQSPAAPPGRTLMNPVVIIGGVLVVLLLIWKLRTGVGS